MSFKFIKILGASIIALMLNIISTHAVTIGLHGLQFQGSPKDLTRRESLQDKKIDII